VPAGGFPAVVPLAALLELASSRRTPADPNSVLTTALIGVLTTSIALTTQLWTLPTRARFLPHREQFMISIHVCGGRVYLSYTTGGRLLLPYPHAGTVISNPFQPTSMTYSHRTTHSNALIYMVLVLGGVSVR
jgi:hypothetical protein